ncbi:D-sedoheptulose-7-phosphate isomerase [Mucilaginibacter polytrichastri]|uniref:Phosphoheptose isomerase n=1 Tax=Mucilaginibacter polytrichastri TaxID=1302689 RepID=A0A1Q5ZTQ5_9SPHI|nr:D-sedoheptulose 7-phosphate isomerase [Mucilaginibacter polytrichastri]OKS85159.1 Phosphoheptose isomerase [Mucilaginibacter polytrichastri]SFS43541.1 D-sedoheptulose 7-phosphate isomerase [Mucilaginibacter polytrichastri]
MLSVIKSQISKSIDTKQALLDNESLLHQIVSAVEMIIDAYQHNKKTLLAGNGGSAADAQHIAAELVARFYFDRPGLSSISLSTDTSIITAVGNDYGFEHLFARQIDAHAVAGDVFIGLSTSGNSTNILKALEVCKAKGVKTIGLTGQSGGQMAALCDICINVPSLDTPRIQESHILIGHIICYLVEETLFGHLNLNPKS